MPVLCALNSVDILMSTKSIQQIWLDIESGIKFLPDLSPDISNCGSDCLTEPMSGCLSSSEVQENSLTQSLNTSTLSHLAGREQVSNYFSARNSLPTTSTVEVIKGTSILSISIMTYMNRVFQSESGATDSRLQRLAHIIEVCLIFYSNSFWL